MVGDVHDHQVRVRSARRRRVLVHRRRRLGHRPQLHRVRPARERRDRADVRGRAEPSGPRPVLGHHRAAPRDDPLHGTDRDPRVREVGRRAPAKARPLVAAAARHRGRADQPRSVDVVPPDDRRGALPDRRHLVADRDGRDHDDAAAGRHPREARVVHARRSSASHRRSSGKTVPKRDRTRAGSSSSTSRGRRCSGRSGATTSASESSTSRASRASTSPATARGATRTATSGSWAASTTS